MKKVNNYLKNYGIEINLNTIIYNGNSLKMIISKLNSKMPKDIRILYLKNCIEVYLREVLNFDLIVAKQIKDFNFRITKYYYGK